MEQIIVLIIFGVISVIGHFASRAKEEAESKRREEEEPTLRRDQIPAEARRQLYGDEADVPMARPRAEAPQRQAPPIPRPAERRSLEDMLPPWEAPRPAPKRQAPQRQAPQRQAPQRQAPQRQAPAPQRPAPQRQASAPPQRRTSPAPQRMPVQQQRPQVDTRPAYAVPVAPIAPVEAQPAPQTAPVAARARTTSAAQLFATRDDLRRGILASEILGAPRAIRRYEALS